MSVVAILQARYSSTRLPGKVLRPILGKPMLSRQIERIRQAEQIDHIVIATSIEPEDTPIADLCDKENVICYRGSLKNVLDRMHQASVFMKADQVMRLTADCPLADPRVLDGLINFFQKGGYDYASNTLRPSFPDGLDAEVMHRWVLKAAWDNSNLPSQMEHVTPYIYNSPNRFKLGHFQNTINLANLRWTVDEPRDLDFVTEIYKALYPTNPTFGTEDILELLGQLPELGNINRGIERNEGLKKSEEEDLIVLTEFRPEH